MTEADYGHQMTGIAIGEVQSIARLIRGAKRNTGYGRWAKSVQEKADELLEAIQAEHARLLQESLHARLLQESLGS